MSLSTIAQRAKLTLVESVYNRDWATFWNGNFIPKWVTLLLGITLAPLVALLIARGMWYLAIPIAVSVLVVILFLRYPFVAIILWLLLAPLLQTTPTMPERIIYWIINRVMPPAVLGVIILVALLLPKKNQLMRVGRAELMLVPFLVIGLLSIILFQPAERILPTLYLFYDRLFIPICLYWIVRLTVPDDTDLKRMLPVILVVAIFQCSVGILTLVAPGAIRPDWRGMGEGARVTGTLRAPGAYTTTLVFLCFILYHAAIHRKPGLIRLIFLSTFAFGCLMVFLSFSRGSWLGGLVAVLGLLVVYPKATLRMVFIISLLMAVFGAGLLANQLDWAAERLQNEKNAQARIVMYHTAGKMIQTRPFFGWGYENFERFRDEFKGRVNNFVVTEGEIGIHNTFLGIMTEMGLVSFFFYIFPLTWWLWLTIKVFPRMPDNGFWSRRLLMVLWLVILDQIIVNNFMDMTHFPFGVSVWWITLGLIASIVCHYLEPGDIGLPGWAYRASVETSP
jgi:O-antigen ligase